MRCFLVCILLLIATSIYAGVYKWIDETGTVHFSSTPPETIKQVEKKVYDAPASVVEGSQKNKQEMTPLDRNMEAYEKYQDNQIKAEKFEERKCSEARARLQEVDSRNGGSRLNRSFEDEREGLDALEDIKNWCKGYK